MEEFNMREHSASESIIRSGGDRMEMKRESWKARFVADDSWLLRSV